jgi:hypothetical protein
MADEFVDLAGKLWDAWEPDAVVMDDESHTFIDPTKVKALNFEKSIPERNDIAANE